MASGKRADKIGKCKFLRRRDGITIYNSSPFLMYGENDKYLNDFVMSGSGN